MTEPRDPEDQADTLYWVGERGPEIVVPSVDGTVVPHAQSMALAAGDVPNEPVPEDIPEAPDEPTLPKED